MFVYVNLWFLFSEFYGFSHVDLIMYFVRFIPKYFFLEGSKVSCIVCGFLFKRFLFIYLAERERQQEREYKQGEWEREKQASHGPGVPRPASILEPWDHDLSRGQICLTTELPGAPIVLYF